MSASKPLLFLLCLLFLLAFGTGCTRETHVIKPASTEADPSSPEEGDPTADGQGGGGGEGEGGDVPPATPKEKCEALIECVADVDPASAGALVTLYGDASNCWKGGESDAEACGKACEKSLEAYPACSEAPLGGHYLALCTQSGGIGTEMLRYDAALTFDPRSGGEATLRLLPYGATSYQPDDAVVTLPTIDLTPASGGGEGESTSPFDIPASAFGASAPSEGYSVHVTDFALSRLRREKTNVCSDAEVTITRPYSMTIRGTCIYLPLAAGDPIPLLDADDVSTACQ